MSASAGKKRKPNRTLIALLVVAVIVVAALVAGGKVYGARSTSSSTTIVKVGIVSEADDVIWDKVNDVLASEGKSIKVVTKSFQGGTGMANQAVQDGDLDLNAFQNSNFLRTQIKTEGYKLTAIGDIYISRYNIYSKKYKDVSSIPDGAKIAIPNNPANAGRAYEVLQKAGLLTLKKQDYQGTYPTQNDVASNPKNLTIEEVDANQIPNLLQDYDAGITNAYAIMDHKMDPVKDAIYNPKLDISGKDHQWVNVIVARTDKQNDKTYKAVVDAYHTKAVAKTINKEFKGAYEVAFSY